MENYLSKISTDLNKILSGRFDNVKLITVPADDNSEDVNYIFNMSNGVNYLYPLTITLSTDGGLNVKLSSASVNLGITRLIKDLKEFAMTNSLDFEVNSISKSNIKKESAGDTKMTESKLWGTNKVSYQRIGETRLIVKHNQEINTASPIGRSQHIGSIYVENSQGERFRYPFKHLNGARAMAEHINHGGNPYDSIGKYITGLSEEMGQLRKFKGYVNRTPVVSESMGEINNKVVARLEELKDHINKLQRSSYYEQFAESFKEQEATQIPEDLINDWVDKLTIRTFNEELKTAFPYIYRLVGENNIKEITPDDFLTNEDVTDDEESEESDVTFKEQNEFESLIEKIVDGESNLFSKNPELQNKAIEDLKTLMASELPVNDNGMNAIESLKGIIEDPDLNEFLENIAKEFGPNFDARNFIKDYIKIKDEELGTDIYTQIGDISAEEPAAEVPAEEPAAEEPAAEEPAAEVPAETGEEPVEEPAEEPTEPQPVTASLERKGNKFVEAILKAKKAGMLPEDMFPMGSRKVKLKDVIRKAGYQVEDFYNVLETADQNIVEFIKSMYDHTSNSFPKGNEGVIIATEKKFGPNCSEQARKIIEKLTSEEGSTGAEIGSSVGGVVGAVAGSRFGKPGAMVGQAIGKNVGGKIGNAIQGNMQSSQTEESIDRILKLSGIKK